MIALIPNYSIPLAINHATNDPWWSFEAISMIVVNTRIFVHRFFQWIFTKLESSVSDEVKVLLLTALSKVNAYRVVTCQVICFVH